MSSETEETFRLNAEWATSLAEDFLKRLGYKHGLLPKKVTLAGEKYLVEFDIDRRTAKVQIDTKTREIKEYEIQEAETNEGFSLSRKRILLIAGASAAASITVIALKLLGFF